MQTKKKIKIHCLLLLRWVCFCANSRNLMPPVIGFAKAKFIHRYCPLLVGIWIDHRVPTTEYEDVFISLSRFGRNSSTWWVEVGTYTWSQWWHRETEQRCEINFLGVQWWWHIFINIMAYTKYLVLSRFRGREVNYVHYISNFCLITSLFILSCPGGMPWMTGLFLVWSV